MSEVKKNTNYIESYLKTADNIISQYNGEVPFAIHIKSYFKLNKKYGSKDRKQIAHFCYTYFRSGKLFKNDSIKDKILKGLFLSTNDKTYYTELYFSEMNELVEKNITEKLVKFEEKNSKAIFPLYDLISTKINLDDFLESQFLQPFLFVRIRPNYLADVLIRLQKQQLNYKIYDPYTIQLPNGFDLAEFAEINKELVVQDFSSQQVFNELITLLKEKQHYKVWDACAASGGKSILLNDLATKCKFDFYVTDVRESILHNLEKRFLSARMMNYKSAVVNLAKHHLEKNLLFDIIICDVPCSGSGTWNRTPERKLFFKQKHVDEFIPIQQKIASNAIKNLQNGGYFIYITCSIYKSENEDNVAFLLQNNNCDLVSEYYIEGATKGADTMYVAILKNRVG
jgi:16S rRNA (cytosine967-C5)-methyltransferase